MPDGDHGAPVIGNLNGLNHTATNRQALTALSHNAYVDPRTLDPKARQRFEQGGIETRAFDIDSHQNG
jgi:hypothetical protein